MLQAEKEKRKKYTQKYEHDCQSNGIEENLFSRLLLHSRLDSPSSHDHFILLLLLLLLLMLMLVLGGGGCLIPSATRNKKKNETI